MHRKSLVGATMTTFTKFISNASVDPMRKIHNMGLIKIFSGSEVLAIALQKKLDDAGIANSKKDNIQSARLAGFGNTDLAVELFIDESDYGKAHPIIEDFRMSI